MKKKHTVHIIHEPLFIFAWERAACVNLILFSEDGKEILAVKKGQNYDILSGRREWDDDSLEDVARREAKEQANVTLDAVTICAVLATPEERLSDVTYELVMTAFVTSKGQHAAAGDHEISFIDKETFLSSYAFGDREEMQVLIGMAEDFRVRRQGKRRDVEGSCKRCDIN